MTYQEFISVIETRISDMTAEDILVRPLSAQKNNNVKRDGIMIVRSGEMLSPTIYLEEYYERYKQGTAIELIVEDILMLYEEIHATPSWIKRDMKEFENVSDIIAYKLIGRARNKTLLEEVPHELFLDLAIVFYLLLDVGKNGTATLLIRNEQLEMWGITAEHLYETAKSNTSKLLPPKFSSMDMVIEEMTSQDDQLTLAEPLSKEEDMYVLSNHICNFGAAVILYDGMLEEVAEFLNDSFYVLPSSIHEVIIVPEKKSLAGKDLAEMVTEINETQVEAEEVLSNRVYYYDNKTGAKLKIVRHDLSI